MSVSESNGLRTAFPLEDLSYAWMGIGWIPASQHDEAEPGAARASRAWGSRGRGFESRHPDHFLLKLLTYLTRAAGITCGATPSRNWRRLWRWALPRLWGPSTRPPNGSEKPGPHPGFSQLARP